MIDHVNHGRRHLNFSEWGRYRPQETDELLKNMCDLAKSREMPLRSYTMIHRRAPLSEADVALLCEWTGETRRRIKSATEDPAGH